MVVGGLGLLCGVCALAGTQISQATAKQPGGGAAVTPADIRKQVPNYDTMQTVSVVGIVGLSTVLIIAGIGLLGMSDWARYLSLACALALIVFELVMLVFHIGSVLPVTEKLMEASLREQGPIQPGFMVGFRIGFIATQVAPAAPFLAYALFLLVAMLRPATAVAFVAPPDLPDDAGPGAYGGDAGADDRIQPRPPPG
jgi:hypothetical protein